MGARRGPFLILFLYSQLSSLKVDFFFPDSCDVRVLSASLHIITPTKSEILKFRELTFNWSHKLASTSMETVCVTSAEEVLHPCEAFVLPNVPDSQCVTEASAGSLHALALTHWKPVTVGAVSSSASRGARGSTPTLNVSFGTILQYAGA